MTDEEKRIVIQELEKIQEEMFGNIVITLINEKDKVILEHNKTIRSNLKIINKHIAEIKGE